MPGQGRGSARPPPGRRGAALDGETPPAPRRPGGRRQHEAAGAAAPSAWHSRRFARGVRSLAAAATAVTLVPESSFRVVGASLSSAQPRSRLNRNHPSHSESVCQ